MPYATDEAGNVWETDAQGNAIRLVKQGGGGQQVPVNPAYQKNAAEVPYAAPQAAANVGKTQTDIADTGEDNRRADLDQIAALYKQGLRPNGRGGVENIPNWTPPPGIERPQADLTQRAGRLNSLVEQIQRTQSLFRQDIDPEPNGIFSSLGDYLPSDENARFDVSGAQLAEKGLAAFKVPGTGTITDRDAAMFEKANAPDSWTRDAAIAEQLRGMRARVDEERATLGLPPVQWDGPQDAQRDPMAAMGGAQGGGNIPGGNAPGGPQMQLSQGGQFSTPQDLALAAAVEKAYRSGGDINALAQAAQSSGYEPTFSDVAGWRQALDYRDQTGKFVEVRPRATGQQSDFAQAMGSAAMTPMGTAAAQYANSATMGIPEALAGSEGFEALGDLNPGMSMVGQIGGAITGTAGLAKAGRSALGGIAPNLFRGGNAGRIGRNLATDVSYGGIYGGVRGDDPLASAGAAGIGSAGGQFVGGALGRIGTGVLNPSARYLAGKEIPLTVGGAVGNSGTLGRMVKGIEDRTSGYVGLGDMAKARQMESIEGFNRAMFRDGLAPINGRVSQLGDEGVEAAKTAKSNFYDSVLDPVPPLPLDARLAGSMVNAKGLGQSVPGMGDDIAYSIDRAMQNAAGGTLNGRGYQSARQRMSKDMKSLPKKDEIRGYDAADIIGDARFELDQFIGRSAGPDVVAGLGKANAANRNISVIEDAVKRARNGTRSGETGLVMPSQLNDAATANAAKFGGTGVNRPFYELGKHAQRVIPNRVPDSGTAGRAGLVTLPLLLGAGGGGAGAFDSGVPGAAGGATSGLATGVGITALLAAAATKPGQKALVAALTKRPTAVRKAARVIRKRKGLFGSAAAPLAIEQVD